LIQRIKIHVREGLIISAEILSTLAGIESMPVDFEVLRLRSVSWKKERKFRRIVYIAGSLSAVN
jgi:hypothetical protein